MSDPVESAPPATHFLHALITEDQRRGTYGQRVVTRFPPEPNGYLHIGHAKSICLNFGLAQTFEGRCHLRFDDTNPTKEETEYVESIQADIKWLGFDWGQHLYFASDYFERMADLAIGLIKAGKAYVDSQSKDQIRAMRGTLTEPGTDSPWRTRSVAENLDLFQRMRAGEFDEGTHVLRAKIDMANPNMLMRDPLLYRIVKATHHRQGNAWRIYPMYDYAHCLEDAIEGVTHSICTLEFENNRELYDWVLDHTGFAEPRPHQHEFARLGLDYTVMSKRKLLQLVQQGHVVGWDDPRMPTLAGLRRRGVTPSAIRRFCDLIGVAKKNSTVDIGKLEYCIRDDLNTRAPRVMAVLDPLKVTLTNWPQGQVETLEASHWPHDIDRVGSRSLSFSNQLFIERADFMLDPPKKYYRLAPGASVRLRHAYIVTCDEVVEDDAGNVVELRCSYDPTSRSGQDTSGRKVRGTIHWVSAAHAVKAEIRNYDRLFTVPQPTRGDEDWLSYLNPKSKVVVQGLVEPSLTSLKAYEPVQFERVGYYVVDPVDSKPDGLVFNRVVSLKDSWGRREGQAAVSSPPKAVASVPTIASSTPKERQRPQKASRAEVRAKQRAADPQLAAAYRRFQEVLGCSADDADVLTADAQLVAFVEEAVAAYPNTPSVTKWIVNTVLGEIKDRSIADLPFSGGQLAALVKLIDDGAISGRVGKDVFADMVANGGEPAAIVEARGLAKISDPDVIAAAVAKTLADNAPQVAAYRAGKTKLFGFFVGQVMKATRGQADANLVKRALTQQLSAEPVIV